MRIMYLTTARHPHDYEMFLKNYKKAPNPSNQNFHNKLINILRSKFPLGAFSTRPMEKNIFLTQSKSDYFYYPGYINTPVLKRLGIITAGLQYYEARTPKVIFVDTLNVTLLELARRLKKRHNVKVIGIVTDNPINITGASKNYSQDVFKKSLVCDGFISLTQGLLRLFNPKQKPAIIVPGFIEEAESFTNKKEKYAFFAGALYPKYGVDALIKTFRKLNPPFKLVIAGHGPLADDLLENKHPNIEFLGQVCPPVAFRLAQRAYVNINPRPIDEQVDLYSVPSKVIDYINSGSVTISTENTEIRNLVGDNIYFIKDAEPHTILEALNAINKNYNYYKQRAAEAKKALVKALDNKVLINKIEDLINKI